MDYILNLVSIKENGKSMRFLFAGRIIWDKGFKQFIDAAQIIKKKYPLCQFDVVGFVDPNNPNAVPYDYILKQQQNKIIKFHGETNDIRSFLNRAHCLVFPSLYREGISRILMEAASMETPIITTDNVGCKELVDHNQTGFIVRKNNPEDLVNAMVNFINMDYNDRLKMGKLARQKIIEEFDSKKTNSIYLKKIDQILSFDNKLKT
ncbi:MAG: glycosyltransferase [Saprospiraceae bacterium]